MSSAGAAERTTISATDFDDKSDEIKEEIIEAESDLPANNQAISEASSPALKRDLVRKKNDKLPQRLISGLITNELGEPLIGANVIAITTNQATITDMDGKFKLLIDDKVEQLQIDYVGYASNFVIIEGQNDVKIQLNEGVALDEVAVTSLKRNKKQQRDYSFEAKPQMGFKKMEKYIRKNRQVPEQAKALGVEGQVLLQFQINEDGTLSDFKVLQSLGAGWDEEAKRLLKEGGKWSLPNGQKFWITTYLFEFKF